MKAAERVIVALDVTSLAGALAMARRLCGIVQTVKVGSSLFTSCGPEGVRRLRLLGFDVMLDLKWFDIPSTVALSCRAAVRHRVSMMTLHAAGGRRMLEAAVGGVRSEARALRARRPLVLGVTVLTSVEDASASQVSRRVMSLARTILQAGCDGVIASAQEAAALRQRFGRRPRIVCPGIRPRQAARGDQRRVARPCEALADGADQLVIGRPITEARDPRAAARTILRELESIDPC